MIRPPLLLTCTGCAIGRISRRMTIRLRTLRVVSRITSRATTVGGVIRRIIGVVIVVSRR